MCVLALTDLDPRIGTIFDAVVLAVEPHHFGEILLARIQPP